jgi:hypothetical protein
MQVFVENTPAAAQRIFSNTAVGRKLNIIIMQYLLARVEAKKKTS